MLINHTLTVRFKEIFLIHSGFMVCNCRKSPYNWNFHLKFRNPHVFTIFFNLDEQKE